MARWHNDLTDRLMDAIMRVETREECYNLLEDLCTIKEIIDMGQRLEVARLLNEKKSYQEISEATGVSTATISRVNKCLTYGNGGYSSAIEKMDQVLKSQTYFFGLAFYINE